VETVLVATVAVAVAVTQVEMVDGLPEGVEVLQMDLPALHFQ
jgi:hypothetical protein